MTGYRIATFMFVTSSLNGWRYALYAAALLNVKQHPSFTESSKTSIDACDNAEYGAITAHSAVRTAHIEDGMPSASPDNNLQLTRYRSMRSRIILSVTLLLCALIALSTWHAYHGYRAAILSAEQLTKSYARALKEHAERTLSESDQALHNFIHRLKDAGGLTRLSEGQ